MAVRVELPKELIIRAIDKEIASLKRSINTQKNPIIVDALKKELATFEAARSI